MVPGAGVGARIGCVWQELGILSAGVVAGVALGAVLSWRWYRRRILRVQVAERRARAAERMAELGSMTAGLAHEIKNPLSTIGLNAQLLAEGVEESVSDPETRARLINRVGALRRETERLRGILSDFLEFAGQVRPDQRPTNINQVVTELVDFFLPEAERHGVRIRADLAHGEVVAHVDVRLLKQAALNLMLNAVQAMGSGVTEGVGGASAGSGGGAGGGGGVGARPPAVGSRGELFLRTAVAEEDRRRVVKIHVIDTGPGIPREAMEKVFVPYFSTKSGGTGLGLPTARRLIEAQGGRVDLYSMPGKGTDFTIVLPYGAPAASAANGTVDGVHRGH